MRDIENPVFGAWIFVFRSCRLSEFYGKQHARPSDPTLWIEIGISYGYEGMPFHNIYVLHVICELVKFLKFYNFNLGYMKSYPLKWQIEAAVWVCILIIT